MMKVAAVLLGVSIIGLFSLIGCSSFGTRPGDVEKEKFRTSKNFNAKEGVFQNRKPNLIKDMRKRMKIWQLLKERYSAGKDRVPEDKLPEVKPDLAQFLEPSQDLKVIWFGHSSFMLNMDGKIILVDPVFSEAAAPVRFMVRRFQKAVLALNELPNIDFILLSHDHYDHLDMKSIKFFADKKVRFVAPLGVGSHLRGWGIKAEHIIEKDWWETASFGDLDFTCTPAQHFSGRNGIHDNETLWASWVIKSKSHKVYFSGDSGYDSHFKEIGEKYGPFDVAFIESGQYDKRWYEVHMPPNEAVVAYKDLKAKKYFPVHWAMFELAYHTWYDPIERLFRLSKEHDIDLVAPKIGQLVNVNRDSFTEKWWRAEKAAMLIGQGQLVSGN